MFTPISTAVSLVLVSLLAACGLPDAPDTPPVAHDVWRQLSGGPGVSVYDFNINQMRVGTVLVTDGASGGAYADQYEFWRWDPAATDDIRMGGIDGFTIKVVHTSGTWSGAAATAFESGTGAWTAFAIPREFQLQTQPRWATSSTTAETFVFGLTADAWGGVQGEIRYALEMDFEPGSDIPSMEWLVDADDIKTYYASEDNDQDPDDWTLPPGVQQQSTRWEVRLTDSTVLDAQASVWGYELSTVYPPQ